MLLRALMTAAALLLVLACRVQPATAQTPAPLVIFPPGTQTEPITGFIEPEGVAVDSSGNLYVATSDDYGPPSYVYKETKSGNSYTQSVVDSGFTNAWGVAVDSSGNVYVADFGAGEVIKETKTGSSTYSPTVIASDFVDPDGVAVDSSGNVYVAEFGCPGCGTNGGLYKLTSGTYAQSSIGTGLNYVSGVTLDSSGNIYAAAWTSFNISTSASTGGALYKLSAGSYTQSTISTNLLATEGVAVDPSGDVYVCDDKNILGGGVVYKETLSGGNYTQSQLITNLYSPESVAIDKSGNLFLGVITSASSQNPIAGGVYEQDYADPPSLSFSDTNVGSTSSTQTVTVNNIGNVALEFEIPSSGNNPSIAPGFTLASGSGSECPLVTSNSSTEGILDPGASCTLPVAFAPQATGSYNGSTLVLTDNNGNASPDTTQTIALDGTGTGTDKASYFTVTGSGSVTAGVQTSITVKAYDALGNLFTGYSGTVHFSSTDGSAVLPANSTLSSGSGTFNVTLKTAGSQTVTATDTTTSSITGSVAITVNVGTTTHLAITAPSSATAGTSFGITVYAYDAYGNFTSSYNGTVHFTSTDGAASLPANSALSSGEGNFTATLHTIGSQTITATDTATSSIAGTSNSIAVDQAPAITSAGSTAFTTGTAGSFTITASGYPNPTFSESGTLPSGVTLNSSGVLGGTPATGTGGSYPITITASNGVGSNASQNFTLTVDQAPAITSANSVPFLAGTLGSFTATASGYPAPTFSESGVLPIGVTLSSSGALSGAPATDTGGSYLITITASNGVGTNATQNFNLTVDQSPAITSPGSTTLTTGTAGSFTVTGVGYPAPTFSETGALPNGISLNSNGTLSGTPAPGTAGTYSLSITASNGVGPNATQSFTLTVNPPPTLVVTSTGDDSGMASNCTVQASTATGTDNSCSLRDALLEAANLGAGNIYFDTTKFASAMTITLGSAGTLNIPSNTTIQGLTSGSGASRTNLVTVSGGGPSSNYTIFNVSVGITVSIANLNITNGNSTVGLSGGISTAGALTLTGCTISGNSTTGSGGGISVGPNGTLNLIDSTVSGNTAAQNGGGISSTGTLNLTESTLSGNSASGTSGGGGIYATGTINLANATISGNSVPSAGVSSGGGIYLGSPTTTLTLANSIVAENSPAGSYPEIYRGSATLTDNGGNFYNTQQSFPAAAGLTLLGNYGGPTQTMVPWPNSLAICAAVVADIPAGVTTDQRGEPNTNTSYAGYSVGTPCVDAGAVQTHYSLSFSTEPQLISPATSIYENANFEAGVTLDESGSPFTGSAVTIPLTLTGTGVLSNGSATTANGVAAYSTLQVSAGGTGDQLTATLALNPDISPTSPAITAASSNFEVTATSAPTITSANAATSTVGATGAFLVTTSGSPTASLSESGTLPSGVTFIDNGNGTATLAGTPAAGSGGVYSVAITANNGIGPNATQSFTLTVDQASAITSVNSAIFAAGTSGSFTITASSYPKASLSESGVLPSGVTFVDNGNGTATLAGTPAAGAGGSYSLTITASNGVGANATQSLALTVDQAPAVTSLSGTTFTTGAPGTFTVATSAYPTAALSESGALPGGVTFIDNGNGTATLKGTAAAGTANTYLLTIMASNGVGPGAAQNFTLTVVPPPTFVVTTAVDDATGTASNCTAGASDCSLRDALAASAGVGGQITFSPTVFAAGNTAAENTITLTNGTLNIPSNTTIAGATSGIGATLTNLVTVSGNNNVQVFNVSSGVTGASIANLIISGGAASNSGGAGIYNQGVLTVSGSTVQHNVVGSAGASYGGGIYNAGGTLTVIGSAILNNGYGEGIYQDGSGAMTIVGSTIFGNNNLGGINAYNGTATITASTIYGNSGGDIVANNSATVTVSDSIVADAQGNFTDGGHNLIGDGSGATGFTNGANGTMVGTSASPLNPMLSALGSYGGPTQSLVPLPGSPAICAMSPSSATGKDQRGDPRTTTYGSNPCQDAGAVQTNYSIAFVQQPSTIVQYATMSPAPSVQLDENGASFTTSSVTIPLTLTTGSGTVTGGSASTSATNGIATYSGLSISLPGTSEVLTATLSLNPALSTPLSISQASSAFNVNSAVTQLAFSTAPALTVTAGGNAGSSIIVHEEDLNGALVNTANDTITLTVTGPNGYAKTYTQAAASGVASFDLSSVQLTTGGVYSYAASIGGSPVTVATASETVGAAAAASVSVVSGSGQSAVIGSAFSAPLKVLVEDQYSNPASGATVVFTGPGSGGGVTFSAVSATATDGTTSVIATANSTASATAYTVTASVAGATTSASFSLTNTQASTTLTVAPSATALVYGQAVTVNASISPSNVLTSAPMGTVTFYDGATALTPASTVSSAAASYAVSVPTVGSHTYAAQYGGDTNFKQSAPTSAAAALVVSKASSTLTGPTSPVSLTYGTGSVISINVAGQYAGAGIATPSGTVNYTIGSGAAQTAAIASGVATLNIPMTQGVGGYTVAVSYAGDSNYNAAAPINVTLNLNPATLTLTANNATKVYGTANPVFTGTVTGEQGGDSFTESFSTTATISSPVNTYAIVPSVTGTNLADYKQVANNGTLSVTQAGTTTALVLSSASITPGQNETLTAQVLSATTGTPTGTMSFYDGTALLSTVTLSGGTASYSTTALAPGLTHTLTAVYSGDANFTGSSSASNATVTVAPLDFTMTLRGPSSLTVVPGQSISYQVTVTPDYDSYAGTVNFTVGGLPPGATVTFSPSSIAANSGPQTITVTIHTAPATALLHHEPKPSSGRQLAPFALAFLALFGAGSLRKRGKMLRGLLCVLLLAGAGLAATMLSGCGSTGGFFAQAPENYTITITATAGPFEHTSTITLNVQ